MLVGAITHSEVANGEYNISADSQDANSFPIITIITENEQPITTKEDWISCTISIDDEQYPITSESAGIKGRGNSTWTGGTGKDPYNIKFDKKVDLFGFGKSKKWCLLAEAIDPSASRNHYMFTIGQTVGANYTMSGQHVNLYLNNTYCGVYYLTEKVETGSNRVDIDDSFNYEDFGFLVELDGYVINEGAEGVEWVYVDNCINAPNDPIFSYGIKDPDCAGNASAAAYIKEYMTQAFDAVYSGDWGTIENWIDTDSFARTYIVEELFNDTDYNWSSFYFYKPQGGKLFSGPLWDFDNTCGFHGTEQPKDYNYDNLVAARSYWYAPLLTHEQFKEKISTILYQQKDNIKTDIGQCYKYLIAHESDFNSNYNIWPITTADVSWNVGYEKQLISWKDYADYTKYWLEHSLEYLLKIYGPFQYTVKYLNEEGDEITPSTTLEAPYGTTVSAPILEIEGYHPPAERVTIKIDNNVENNLIEYTYTTIICYATFISDNEIIQSVPVQYGKSISMDQIPSAPDKTPTDGYKYRFLEWDNLSYDRIIEDVLIYAIFCKEAMINTIGDGAYSITVNENTAPLSSSDLETLKTQAQNNSYTKLSVGLGLNKIEFDNLALQSLVCDTTELSITIIEKSDLTDDLNLTYAEF